MGNIFNTSMLDPKQNKIKKALHRLQCFNWLTVNILKNTTRLNSIRIKNTVTTLTQIWITSGSKLAGKSALQADKVLT